jgi:hypothetical protein
MTQWLRCFSVSHFPRRACLASTFDAKFEGMKRRDAAARVALRSIG